MVVLDVPISQHGECYMAAESRFESSKRSKMSRCTQDAESRCFFVNLFRANDESDVSELAQVSGGLHGRSPIHPPPSPSPTHSCTIARVVSLMYSFDSRACVRNALSTDRCDRKPQQHVTAYTSTKATPRSFPLPVCMLIWRAPFEQNSASSCRLRSRTIT